MSAEFWAALFKSENDEGEDDYAKNPVFQGIISLLREDLNENIGEANAIGEELRAAITAAFDNDGKVDEAEYEKIKEYFRQLNELMARAEQEAKSEAEFVKRRMTFDKGQNLSYEAMMDYINENVIPQRQEELDFWEDNYKQNRYALEYKYQRDYEAADSDEARAAVDQKYNEVLGGQYASGGQISFEALDAELARKQAEVYSAYDEGIMAMMDTTLHESDISEADALIERLAGKVLSGSMSEQDARNVLSASGYTKGTGLFGTDVLGERSQASQANEYWQREIAALGGREAIEGRIDYYNSVGAEEDANRLAMLLAKSDFFQGANLSTASNNALWWVAGSDVTENNMIAPQAGEEEQPPNTIPLRLDEYGEPVMHTQAQETTALPSPDELLSGGASPYTIPMTIEGAEAAAALAHEQAQSELDSEGDVTIQTEADTQGFDALPSPDELAKMYGISTTVNVEATPEQTASPYTIPLTLEGAGAEASTARSEMDSILEPPIDTSVAFPGAVSVAASVYQSIKSQFKDIIQHVQIVTHGGSYPGMATGGRATEPVVYAEAGPEWFIPERHDRNTANLIAMAAHASGFSLAELATMSGARLFADGGTVGGSLPSLGWSEMDYSDSSSSGDSSGGNTYDVHYAPVIHAENAEGVDKALQDDKKRLKKLLKEIDEERELIGSVVSY